jgi:hypothetical protein
LDLRESTSLTALRRAALDFCGSAADALLTRLTQDLKKRRAQLLYYIKRHFTWYVYTHRRASVDARVIYCFALVYAAGRLAQDYGILPWDPNWILWSVATCQNAHFAATEAIPTPEHMLRAFVQYLRNNYQDIRPIPDPTITGDVFQKLPGLLWTRKDGSKELVISRAALKRATPFDCDRVLAAVAAYGFLIGDIDGRMSKAPVRGSSRDEDRFRCYRIKYEILGNFPATNANQTPTSRVTKPGRAKRQMVRRPRQQMRNRRILRYRRSRARK